MPGIRCWDHIECGKEKKCPAYPDHGFNCWDMSGTLCRDERQGDYDQKVGDCRTKCEYYNGVMGGTIRVT